MEPEFAPNGTMQTSHWEPTLQSESPERESEMFVS